MRAVFGLLVTLGAAGLLFAGTLRAAPEPIKIGTRPENFTLTCSAGKSHTLLTNEKPAATVVLFIATQCPVSLAYDQRMAELGKTYTAKGVRFIAVNSNKQEPMAEVGTHAAKAGFNFPVVKDPNNVIADKWGAMVTPEAYVLDRDGVLQYHGRVDDSQNPSNVKSQDLKAALDAILAGKTPEKAETRAFGCTIKRV